MTPTSGAPEDVHSSSAESTRQLELMRRQVTILFTDIKGSTAYFEKFGDAAGLMMVNRCNGLVAKAVERHSGRVLKTIGDSVMACFDEPVNSVSAAIETQEALAEYNLSKSEAHRISLRIGVNYGQGIVRSNDVYGDVVNVASRVEGAAAPNQIVISHALYLEIGSGQQFTIRHIGRFSLKGKSADQDLYEVVWGKRPIAGTSVSHNLIAVLDEGMAACRFKLIQMRADGRAGKEYELMPNGAQIGRTKGDIIFPHDDKMLSPHATLTVEGGQLFVSPVEDALIFMSLVGPYRLQPCDVIRIGAQHFEFHEDKAAIQNASLSGTTLAELSKILPCPAAEFMTLDQEQKSYPILEEQTTWGRTKATYVFPADTTMSRSHAKVYYRGEDFFLEDTGSTNGTFVMVKEKTPIPDGVVLSTGSQLLKVAREEA
jgi:class 3 adenylate cyclase/pSer/pThr/pTyr-binding forkhead associated (FHA) protein